MAKKVEKVKKAKVAVRKKTGKKTKTNPLGANQFLLDPRQKVCWEFYVDPRSKTFGNAYQSAVKAGYSKGSALQITTQPWFLEKTRRLNMLSKAEKVLDEMLELKAADAPFLKIKQDTAKFVAERLGKDNGYSTRTEMTGKDGESINISYDDDQRAAIAKRILERGKPVA